MTYVIEHVIGVAGVTVCAVGLSMVAFSEDCAGGISVVVVGNIIAITNWLAFRYIERQESKYRLTNTKQ